MTLMVGKRRKIMDADLVTTTVAETDAADGAAWSGATAYVIGHRVRRSTTDFHRTFECVQAHTNKDPMTAANVGPTAFWVLVAWTNRWRVFDDAVSQQATAPVDFAYWRIRSPGSDIITHIAVFNAAGNTLRITKISYVGLLGASALAPNSEGFGGWTATGATVVTNTIPEPLTLMRVADELQEDTSTGVHQVAWAGANTSFTSGLSYTMSIYAKRGSGTRNVRLRFPTTAFAANTFGNFTLSGSPGTVGLSGGATAGTCEFLGNGWYRCAVTATCIATTSQPFATVQILDAALAGSYTGTTGVIYINGINLSQGSTLLQYYLTNEDGISYSTRAIIKTHVFEYNDYRYVDAVPYNPDVIVETGTVISPNDQFEVSIEQGAPDLYPRVGEIVAIFDTEILGEFMEPLDESLLDFSVKTRDDFGNITLIPRNAADDINYTFRTDRANRNRVKSVLKSRRGIPLVFFDSDDPDNLKGIMSYGFINGYSMPLLPTDAQIVSLDTEGLT